MTACWNKDPKERPPFDELTPKLYRMLEDEEVGSVLLHIQILLTHYVGTAVATAS